MIPTPQFILAAILAFILTLGGGFWWGDIHGDRLEKIVCATAVTQNTNTALTDKIKTDETLSKTSESLKSDNAKEAQNAETKTQSVAAAVGAGTIRLRNPTCPRVQTAVPENSAPGPATTDATLLPATAERIYTIGRDADSAVRERNYCIAQYNAIADQLARLSASK